MKYSIDRIEENIAILENIDTKEKLEIEIDKLPENIKEGNILKQIDEEYKLDVETEKERKESIKERFQRLKKN